MLLGNLPYHQQFTQCNDRLRTWFLGLGLMHSCKQDSQLGQFLKHHQYIHQLVIKPWLRRVYISNHSFKTFFIPFNSKQATFPFNQYLKLIYQFHLFHNELFLIQRLLRHLRWILLLVFPIRGLFLIQYQPYDWKPFLLICWDFIDVIFWK